MNSKLKKSFASASDREATAARKLNKHRFSHDWRDDREAMLLIALPTTAAAVDGAINYNRTASIILSRSDRNNREAIV